MRKINKAGLDLLKQFEGCRLKAYKDIGGVLTIGYGSTGPHVTEGLVITQNEADALLEKDLERFYHIDQYLSEMVSDNAYSALIVLAFNIGLKALKMSTLIKRINSKDNPDSEWLRWNKVNGQVVEGLTRRRKEELKLFHRLG